MLGLLCCCGPQRTAEQRFSHAKWFYCVGFALTAVLTWVLRDQADEWLAKNVPTFNYCKGEGGEVDAHCAGKEVALRISFANCCFFTLHLLLTLGMKRESDPRTDLHGGFWGLKFLLWVGALVGFFFIPESTLYGYAMAARVGSGFFLILQMVLLVAFVYEVNEWLVAKDTKWSWGILVVGTIICFGLSLAMIGILYHFYALEASCSKNIFFITWSLVIGIAMLLVLFVPNRAESAGLLTSGAVFLYCTYLLYSALSSSPPDEQCTRGLGTSAKWIQIVAFFISIFSVIYSTISAGISSRDLFGNSAAKEDAYEALPYRADFYHLVFALASMYIAMLFTNWQVSSSTNDFELDKGWASTWVKMASKWLCELLYIWTVIAPALFPDRDFSGV